MCSGTGDLEVADGGQRSPKSCAVQLSPKTLSVWALSGSPPGLDRLGPKMRLCQTDPSGKEKQKNVIVDIVTYNYIPGFILYPSSKSVKFK